MMPEGELKCKTPLRLKLPEGEVYHHIESARGDAAVYLVSDGSDKPYRLKWRSPTFINLSAMDQLAKGWKIADLVAILGSLDIVLGEIDR